MRTRRKKAAWPELKVYNEPPAALDPACLTEALLSQLGIKGGIQVRSPHLELRQDGYYSCQSELLGWDEAIPLHAAQVACLQWEYHVLHQKYFDAAGDIAPDGQFDPAQSDDFQYCFESYDPLAGLEEKHDAAYKAQAQAHLDLARRWAVLHLALCVPKGLRQDNTINGIAVLHAIRSDNISCLPEIESFYERERQACQLLLSGLAQRATDEQLLHCVQQLGNTTGIQDAVIIHGTHLKWNAEQGAYYADHGANRISAEVQIHPDYPLNFAQVALLQWELHDLRAWSSDQLLVEQRAQEMEWARKWLVVCIAAREGAIDQTGVINKPLVWSIIRDALDHRDKYGYLPAAAKHSLREEQDAYRQCLLPIPIACVAMGCVLAAVACGACVWAMPLLWPSVLGTAGHWAMVGVAAAGGAAIMGCDIRSQSEWSWARVLCGALVLGILAASVGALSHVALPWLAVTHAWSAGATAAAGTGLTLFAMCGLGGLAGRVRGKALAVNPSVEA